MTLKKKKILTLKQCDELLNNLDITPILDSRVRQVRWLYNNCNKCLMVYDEKLVRLIVHRLRERNIFLEESNKRLIQENKELTAKLLNTKK